MIGKIGERGKRGSKQQVTGPLTQVRRQVKQEKVDQWPPYATRRNLIQVSARYTCTVLHKDFEPRRQLEPRGLRDLLALAPRLLVHPLPILRLRSYLLSCFLFSPSKAKKKAKNSPALLFASALRLLSWLSFSLDKQTAVLLAKLMAQLATSSVWFLL